MADAFISAIRRGLKTAIGSDRRDIRGRSLKRLAHRIGRNAIKRDTRRAVHSAEFEWMDLYAAEQCDELFGWFDDADLYPDGGYDDEYLYYRFSPHAHAPLRVNLVEAMR